MNSPDTEPQPQGQALPAGTRLEEFIIEKVLGAGGFGVTYLARDVSLDRLVVIKENLPVQFAFRDPHSLTVAPRHSHGEDAENFAWSLENFSKEAAMLASLDHPGIVKVLRRFEAFGTAYFVMPFVEGEALDVLLRRRAEKPFTEQELRGLLEHVLKALTYLHERGIYHRDIKPGNILMTHEDLPVLIDFGSARQRLSERSMTVVESAGYTPFEQLQSRGNVGPWSDLYALGATITKLVTGELPPKAMDRMRRDPFEPLAERPALKNTYSHALLSSIDKALRVDEDARWQNAQEWLAALSSKSLGQQERSASPSYEPDSPVVETPTKPDAADGKDIEAVGVIIAIVLMVFLGAFALWVLSENIGTESVKSDESDSSEHAIPSIVTTPPPEVGGLRIISDPTDGQVLSSDGRSLGVTPRTIPDLPVGEEVTFRLELAGYAPETVSGVPLADETLTLPTVIFTPLPQNVRVSSTPSGAEVWNESRRLGTTETTITNIMPGTRVSYAIKKDGYEYARVEGAVEVNETLELHANLNLLPNRPADSQDMDNRAEGWIIVKINDIDYVDMKSVKRFYLFTKHHLDGRDFILSNESRPRLELRFKIGSDFSSFNDVKFTLFNKIISQDERVFLSRMDLAKIIDPVLRPSFIESGQHFNTVILNPVGDGKDDGNRGTGFTEAEYTLRLAQRTARILETRGFKVVFTHEIPEGVSLEKRLNKANAVNEPAVVLSIGLAHGTSGNRGIHTYVADPLAPKLQDMNNDTYPASVCLATAVHGSALTRLGNNAFDNSISRTLDSFTRRVKHPVVLFQGGYLSHPDDARLMGQEPYQKSVAKALADGVVRYRAAVTRSPTPDNN